MLPTSRALAMPAAAPRATPSPGSFAHIAQDHPQDVSALGAQAMRIPVSPRRFPTVYDINPYRPIIASVRERAPKKLDRSQSRVQASSLIQLESVLIVARQGGILVLFPEKTVTDRESLDLSAHEAPESVFRRAYDRLSTNIEARVDDHRTTRPSVEGSHQRVVARVRFLVNRLNPGRIVHVRHRRDIAPRSLQFLDPEQGFIFVPAGPTEQKGETIPGT